MKGSRGGRRQRSRKGPAGAKALRYGQQCTKEAGNRGPSGGPHITTRRCTSSVFGICVSSWQGQTCFLNQSLSPVSPAAPAWPRAGTGQEMSSLSPQSPPLVSESLERSLWGHTKSRCKFQWQDCLSRPESTWDTHLLRPHGHSPPVLLLFLSQSPGVRQRWPQTLTLGSEQGVRRESGYRLLKTICFPSTSQKLT